MYIFRNRNILLQLLDALRYFFLTVSFFNTQLLSESEEMYYIIAQEVHQYQRHVFSGYGYFNEPKISCVMNFYVRLCNAETVTASQTAVLSSIPGTLGIFNFSLGTESQSLVYFPNTLGLNHKTLLSAYIVKEYLRLFVICSIGWERYIWRPTSCLTKTVC